MVGLLKNIKVEIYLGDDDVLQRKYINILPSKEGYLLPINKDVYSEIENTIKNEGYDSNLNIKITYKHNVE
ncbi:membrane protein [Staphylococcus gallinarum]|uniref:Membrane protein n=1 Tax=Staphylococcus gallinarum TaxID=1293 RepID=A0A380FCR9_STAGA|nr:membrane protein [Staphylococcus gallinarum]